MEVYKPVEEFNQYLVSNYGNITRDGKLLNPPKYSGGYKVQKLYLNGKYKREMVHRLVAKAFIPKIAGKDCVNHIDGNKENNCASNLEWVTLFENLEHATKTGLRSRGDKHPLAKIRCTDVPTIKELSLQGWSQRQIAAKYNVCQATIKDILKNVTWKHVTKI
jgi:hypothetical protein